MRSVKYLVLSLVGVLFLSTFLFGLDYVPREIIVKTTEPLSVRSVDEIHFGVADLDNFIALKGARQVKVMTPSPTNRYYTVRLNEDFSLRELEQLNNLRSEGIEYVQPNYLNKQLLKPNDPLFPQQFLEHVNLPEAWEYETGSSQVVVAVVDSGLWFEHPEFKSFKNIWINNAEYPPNGEDSDGNGYVDDWCGWDFVDAPEMADIALGDYLDQDNDPNDETGHGTHVAGIIGAESNNSIGVAGICWDVKIMVLRAGFRTTLSSGYLQDDDAAAAIIYAVDNGANVINISWGSDYFSPVISDVCQYAYERGVIVVASAGNTPQPEIMFPARLNTTVAVGAVNKNLTLAGFSSYGPDIDLVAPGDFVLSTYLDEGGYVYKEQSGTSMSAPFVTAAVALLLSFEPGLSVEEVKARLFASATDLGDPGFDNRYGNGLLNVEKLLTGEGSPLVNITYPVYDVGVSGTFDIIGTLKVPELSFYNVMFTGKENPSSLDWKDIKTHTNTPTNYRGEKHDETIATFYVPPTLPDDDYLVQIRIETKRGQSFEKRFRVQIKQNKPKLEEGYPLAVKRYNVDIPHYYITLGFDQAVSVKMDVVASDGTEASVYSNQADYDHVLKIPDYLPEGSIAIKFTAKNIGGQEYISEIYSDIIEIEKKGIPTDKFIQNTIGMPVISIPKTRDFDNNGYYEFVGMDINPEQTYGNVNIFEFKDGTMNIKHTFEDKFLPLDLGDTNNRGIEILGLVGDRAVLYETIGSEKYPNVALWSENNVTGGNFIDYKNKGYEGVALVQNYQNQSVLRLYARAGNFFDAENTLYNPSSSYRRNTFAPRLAAGDLNNNGYTNIVTSDLDGDVFVYEIYSPSSDSLVWETRIPVKNLYYQAVADFTGDGKLDFCVGGYESDYADNNKSFWYFEFFTYDDASKGFKSLGYVAFDHYESTNSISTLDFDGDGASELILALTPYLFIIKYVDGQFVPIWQGDSVLTYNVVTLPKTDHHPAGVIVNAIGEEGLVSQFVTSSDYAGTPAPTGLVINPLDESSVELSWDNDSASKYYIYRATVEEEVILLDTTTENTYLDADLTEGVEYFYALRSYNESYTPNMSYYTPWRSVTPLPVPELLSIRVASPKELQLLFDVQLSNEAINVGSYSVNNGIGRPTSANHISNHKGVLLRFEQSFEKTDEPYLIEIVDLKGRTGVLFPTGAYPFEYEEDLTPPEIIEYYVTNQGELVIKFSEDIDSITAQDKGNYELVVPQIDPLNGIDKIICMDSTISVSFKEKLKMSNQSYYLKMKNIVDLAGNRLPNNQNVVKFQVEVLNDLTYVQAIPNPFNRTKNERIEFIGLPIDQEGQLKVYTLNGDLVFEHKISGLTPQNNTFKWRGVNNSGKKLSSGMYFYVISMGGNQKRGHVAIIN